MGKKRERIKRNTLIGHVLDGGIGIVDLETKLKSLKASWIPKILKNMGNLHCFLNSICVEHNIDINYILKRNARKQSDFNIVKTLPVFYKETFCSFNEAKTVLPFNQLNNDLFLQQTIWNNLYFKVRGKPLDCSVGVWVFVTGLREKEGDLTQSYDKTPYTNRCRAQDL